MFPPDSSPERPPITDEQLMRLKQARIVPQRYRLTDWCKFIHRRVSPEKAARYLELYTPQGKPDVEKLKEQIAERSFLATSHGQGYIITVADLLGYEGTSSVEFDAAPCGEAPPLRVGWQSFAEWLMQWKGVLGALAFLVAVLGVLAQMVDIRPPRTMLTIVLDASAPMGRFVSVDRTLWDVALDIAQSRLPDPRYGEEYAKRERVAIWIERGKPSANGCIPSHNRLTKGYVPSEGLEMHSLAADIQPMGLPNPGPALREAMRNAPENLLQKTSHRAVILTSGAKTCTGKSPLEEICEVLRLETFRWTTYNSAKLSHDVIILDLQGSEIKSETLECDVDKSVLLTYTQLDPQRPEESNRELCKMDAGACDKPVFPTATITSTPTPLAVVASPASPTPAPLAPTTPSSSLPPTIAPTVGLATPAPTPSPIASQATAPPSVAPGSAPTATPTATPVFAVRVPDDRRVSVREGCNQGRVIGEIGRLPSGQYVEALVPVIPNDFAFLETDGCLRIFTGILGDPHRGFPGFVRAEEVCVLPFSYDYWRRHPSFPTALVEKWLPVCQN